MQQEQQQQPSHLQPQHDDPTRYGIVVAGDHHVNEDSLTEETADDLLNKLKESGEYQRYVVYSVMNVGFFFSFARKTQNPQSTSQIAFGNRNPIFWQSV